MKRLAIITTHPIQYYAPIFRLLNERENISIKVFYTWEKDASLYDKDFGKEIKWDIPLLEGYDYQYVSNNGSFRRDFLGVKNPGIIGEIENWGADAILVFGWNYRSHLRIMRHFKNKIPVLFRGDSTLLDERPGWKRTARRLFLRWVYSHVDKALYVGSNNKEYFLEHGLRNEQLLFAPHAIDNDRFYREGEKWSAESVKWRNELGIEEHEIVFIFVGKFQSKKNPLLLIQAFNELEVNAHLVMVGNGELESSLKELSRSNRRIHFLPFQNQSRMPVVYRIGNVFCLPSQGPGETWGLAVNEAMACGRAVLLSDRCGCTADLLVEGRNGFAFASGNKKDLVNKMRILTAPDQDIRSLGLFSAHLIQSWSYNEVVPAIERLILQ